MSEQNVSNNPFASLGKEVYGEFFFGRSQELNEIREKIWRNSASGNIAIHGEPRIGKSSLAYQAIIQEKQSLLGRGILPFRLTISRMRSPEQFYESLLTELRLAMRGQDWWTLSLEEEWKECQSHFGGRVEDLYLDVKFMVRFVRNQGRRLVIVLDEFDAVTELFGESVESFHEIRELSNQPETDVTWVVVSRRTIDELEAKVASLSNFAGIFGKPIYLTGYDTAGFEEYLSCLMAHGIPITDGNREMLQRRTGLHPYLLAHVGFDLLTPGTTNRVEEALERQQAHFIGHYLRVIEYLDGEGTLQKLLQVLFGPTYNVKQSDIDRMKQYGLIFPEGQGYRAMSENFEDYLRHESREIDLWPLWSAAERLLREFVEYYLIRNYGPNWPEKFKSQHPKLADFVHQMQETQLREIEIYGDRASRNLLDYSYPDDLFKIMGKNETTYFHVLGGDKSLWWPKWATLNKVRNRYAHQREFVLSESDRNIAKAICEEIVDRLNQWKDSIEE